MLLHTLEKCVDMFPDIFCGEFFDDLLESGFGVGTVCGDLAWCCRLEETFDSFEVILEGINKLIRVGIAREENKTDNNLRERSSKNDLDICTQVLIVDSLGFLGESRNSTDVNM